jgi:hypothetical protein
MHVAEWVARTEGGFSAPSPFALPPFFFRCLPLFSCFLMDGRAWDDQVFVWCMRGVTCWVLGRRACGEHSSREEDEGAPTHRATPGRQAGEGGGGRAQVGDEAASLHRPRQPPSPFPRRPRSCAQSEPRRSHEYSGLHERPRRKTSRPVAENQKRGRESRRARARAATARPPTAPPPEIALLGPPLPLLPPINSILKNHSPSK